jgi:hypothetical protein
MERFNSFDFWINTKNEQQQREYLESYFENIDKIMDGLKKYFELIENIDYELICDKMYEEYPEQLQQFITNDIYDIIEKNIE